MPSISLPTATAVITFGPHPSLAVIKNWKSIVELIMRAVCAVLALFCLIACAVAEDDASHDDLDTGLLTRSNAAAGWGLFLCFVAMVTEVVIVLMRFLNCGFVSNFLTISMIVDMAVSGVFAVLLFITGIPLAVYASEWDDELDDAPSIIKDSLKKLPPSLRAASAFCFLAMIGFIVLLVWILLHLVLGWCKQPSTEAHKADA